MPLCRFGVDDLEGANACSKRPAARIRLHQVNSTLLDAEGTHPCLLAPCRRGVTDRRVRGGGYGFEELWQTSKRGGRSVRGVAQLGQSGLDLQAQTVSMISD